MHELWRGAERGQHPFHARTVGGDGRLEQDWQARRKCVGENRLVRQIGDGDRYCIHVGGGQEFRR